MSVNNQKIRILTVEDDEVDFMTLQRALKKCRFEVSLERADTLEAARNLLKGSGFHCIFLDYRLPDGTGLDLLSSSEYLAKKNVVIMLTGEDDILIAVEAMKMGAQDYIPKKSVCKELLEISITKALETIELENKVREYQKKIEELAFFDSLTGLPNRYVFEDRLQQLIRMAKRTAQTFWVGILDLNKFKEINDNMGHLAGDTVLQTVASRLASLIREGDTIARFGGDEFVLLLPESEIILGVEKFSVRLLDAIAEPILIEGEEIQVGISIGFSRYPAHGRESDVLIKHADDALYEAKASPTGQRWKIANIDPEPSMTHMVK